MVETGSHRWQGAAHRTGRRGHGWGTGGLYYIHCPSGKGSNLGNCLHRVGKEMMGEKIRKQGKSVFRPENGHDSIGH